MSTNEIKKKTPREKRTFPAKEKCEAVLSVWSERRKSSEVCRELGLTWQQFENWQKAAMKGMLQALEPRRGAKRDRPAPLGPRLEKLLEKTQQQARCRSRLETRLEAIEKAKETGTKKSASATSSPNA